MFRILITSLISTAFAESSDNNCHVSFLGQVQGTSTSIAKCAALDSFARCTADLEASQSPSFPAQLLALEQAQLLFGVSEGCAKHEVEKRQASIRSTEGNVDITVDGKKDIRIQRFRKSTVSLFELAETVEASEAKLGDDIATAKAEFEVTRKTLVEATTSLLDKRMTAQQAAIDVLLQNVSQEQQEMRDSFEGMRKYVATTDDVKKVGEDITKLSNSIDQKLVAVGKTATKNSEDTKAVDDAFKKTQSEAAKCVATGKIIVDGKCVVVDETIKSVKCAAGFEGVTRWNAKKQIMQVCAKGLGSADDTGYGFESLEFKQKRGTKLLGWESGSQILKENPDAKSGMYYIQPPGEPKSVLTFCDMEKFKGYCLASYGHLVSTGCHSGNRNIPNMNNPDGYNWKPEARSGLNGVIALSEGAVLMAQNAKSMIMAATTGAKVTKGGPDGYSHVYEIDITPSGSSITFENHARGSARGCSLTPAQYNVQCLKGESGGRLKSKEKRGSLKESLGISWTDSHPTGYGFSAQWRRCSRNWSDGPYFPSIHAGPYPYRRGGCAGGRRTWAGNDVSSEYYYAHQGWYGMYNGQYNRRGAMSIWFN